MLCSATSDNRKRDYSTEISRAKTALTRVFGRGAKFLDYLLIRRMPENCAACNKHVRTTPCQIRGGLRADPAINLYEHVVPGVIDHFPQRLHLRQHGFMNDWPPNPGFTVMITTISACARTYSTASRPVDGLRATPERIPSSRIRVRVLCK